MPRLDAERIELLRDLARVTTAITREIDADLLSFYDLPLGWFEVMSALQRNGGELRVSDLAKTLGELPSSLSRRLDRMQTEGHVERGPLSSSDDRRTVMVKLTRDGRLLWRDANVIYRRAVQRSFAKVVTETDINSLQRLLSKLAN